MYYCKRLAKRCVRWILFSCLLCSISAPALASTVISQISTGVEQNTIEIIFKCPVDYLDHSPRVTGPELKVHLRPGNSCQNLWPEVNQTVPTPIDVSDQVARVEVVGELGGEANLVLTFHNSALFLVRQGAGENSIVVLARTSLQDLPPAQAPDAMDTVPDTSISASKSVPADVKTIQSTPISESEAPTLAASTPAAKSPPERILPAEDLVSSAGMNPQRISELMQEARDNMIDGDFDRSVLIYSNLLQEPDTGHHDIALEYLGVAEQKKGRIAQAVADYRTYLQRFPEGPGADRVKQRLDALLIDDVASTTRAQAPAAGDRWQYYGGVSQDYWSNTEDFRTLDTDEISQSSLLTLADLVVDRRGERFDLRARVNAGYQNDLSSDIEGPGNQALVSNAYLEILDQKLDLSTKIGRQTLYTDGVLGRFDGVRASYRWKPDIRFNVTAGVPVDSPRYYGDTNRQFIGASVNFDRVLEHFDITAFTHFQMNDGISDREAVGAEVQFREGAWQVMGSIDYDASYSVLNSALIHTSYQWSDRIELHGRINAYALPFLTSRNALIGQSVATIGELEEFYTEGQIRRLAENRTSNVLSTSGGLTMTLTQRWYANADVTYMKIDGAIASGGVAANPASTLIYSSANMIGSSIFREGDTTIFGIRVNSTEQADTTTLLADFRVPIGDSLRVGPRLALSWRDGSQDGDQQLIAEPGMRLTYRFGKRYRIELEGGGRWSERSIADNLLSSVLYPDDEEQTVSYFFNLGWRVDF